MSVIKSFKEEGNMEQKVNLGNQVVPPMPVALVGAMVEGKANFMTTAWLSRVNFKPPMLVVALNKGHLTSKGIEESGTFSVCFPDVSMEEVTDYCGVVSGRKVDKGALFELFYGETETAPMIERCPFNIECRLEQVVELPTNNLYIGEIVAGYTEEIYMTGNKLDFEKADPLFLTMPDNNYWKIGPNAGKAWKDGLRMKGN